MPKKGGKQLSDRERARLAVIPDLYAIYSTYFTEGVIDMIAKQCNYEMDACLATLADMVHDGGHAQTIPAPTSNAAAMASSSAVGATSSKVHSSTLSAIKEAARDAAASVTSDAKKSLPQGTRLLQPSATSAAANNKQQFHREQQQQQQPQPPQPASMWKTAEPPTKKPTQMPWISNTPTTVIPEHRSHAPKSSVPPSSSRGPASALDQAAFVEAGYGSDANDPSSSLADSAAADGPYRYTGFESQPYFDLQPSLLDQIPRVVELPTVPPSTVLDPQAASAVRARRSTPAQLQRDSLHSASPANPEHHLHALYLQLQQGAADADDEEKPKHEKWKRTTFSAPPTPSVAASLSLSSLLANANSSTATAAAAAPAARPAHTGINHSLEQLTPAQALAHQSSLRLAQSQEKRERREWEKKHEREKLEWKQSGHESATVPAGASDGVTDEEKRMIAEAEALSLAESSGGAYDLDSLPTDIPSLAPLSRAESLASYERVRARPQELEDLLTILFGDQVDRAIINMIVESVIHAPMSDPANSTASPSEDGPPTRDIAQECCDTLLAIVAENERERERRYELEDEDASFAASSSTSIPAGGKARRPGASAKKGASSLAASSTPFVASTHQLTDSELAWRLSVDPDFDPEALPPMDANVGLQPQSASSAAAAPVVRNKKGHVLLPRGTGTANVWAMRGAPSSVAAPDLGAQWKLAALHRAFPTVDRESVEECFRVHAFQFEETKAHLRAIYPNALVDEAARPTPVEQPWSSTSRHHSKVTTTSRNDAERGIVRDDASKWDQSAGYGKDGGASAAMAAITDAELEAELGPVLDGRSVAGPSHADPSALRHQAHLHASRRAAYFSAAVSAFTRGMGTVASELADKGKRSSRALADATARGGVEVFRSVNAGKDCRNVVDLHGLHVVEAMRILPFLLRRRAIAGAKELAIVTGLGHHSLGGLRGARLAPAVLEYIKRAGYSYTSRGEGEIRVFFR